MPRCRTDEKAYPHTEFLMHKRMLLAELEEDEDTLMNSFDRSRALIQAWHTNWGVPILRWKCKVHTLGGETIEVQVHSLETVLHLARKVQAATSTTSWSQQIFVAGREEPLHQSAAMATVNGTTALYMLPDSQADIACQEKDLQELTDMERYTRVLSLNACAQRFKKELRGLVVICKRSLSVEGTVPRTFVTPHLQQGSLGIPYTQPGTRGAMAVGKKLRIFGEGGKGWCHWRLFRLYEDKIGYYPKFTRIALGPAGMEVLGPAPQETIRLGNLDAQWVSRTQAYPRRAWTKEQETQLRSVQQRNRQMMGVLRDRVKELVQVKAARQAEMKRGGTALGTGRWVRLKFNHGVPESRRELLLKAPDEDKAHQWRVALRDVAVQLWSSGALAEAEAKLDSVAAAARHAAAAAAAAADASLDADTDDDDADEDVRTQGKRVVELLRELGKALYDRGINLLDEISVDSNGFLASEDFVEFVDGLDLQGWGESEVGELLEHFENKEEQVQAAELCKALGLAAVESAPGGPVCYRDPKPPKREEPVPTQIYDAHANGGNVQTEVAGAGADMLLAAEGRLLFRAIAK